MIGSAKRSIRSLFPQLQLYTAEYCTCPSPPTSPRASLNLLSLSMGLWVGLFRVPQSRVNGVHRLCKHLVQSYLQCFTCFVHDNFRLMLPCLVLPSAYIRTVHPQIPSTTQLNFHDALQPGTCQYVSILLHPSHCLRPLPTDAPVESDAEHMTHGSFAWRLVHPQVSLYRCIET